MSFEGVTDAPAPPGFFRSAALPPTRRPPSFFLLRPLRHGIPRSPALCPFCFSTDSVSRSTFRYKSRSSPDFTSSKRPLALRTSLLERFFLLRFVYGESLPTSDIDHKPRGYKTSFLHDIHVIVSFFFFFLSLLKFIRNNRKLLVERRTFSKFRAMVEHVYSRRLRHGERVERLSLCSPRVSGVDDDFHRK